MHIYLERLHGYLFNTKWLGGRVQVIALPEYRLVVHEVVSLNCTCSTGSLSHVTGQLAKVHPNDRQLAVFTLMKCEQTIGFSSNID